MVGIDGDHQLAQGKVCQLGYPKAFPEHPVCTEQQVAGPAVTGFRAAFAGGRHGLAFVVVQPGIDCCRVLQQAIEEFICQPHVYVVGNLGRGAVAGFNQGFDFPLHGIAGVKIIQGNLDQVQHQAYGHGNQNGVPGKAVGEPLPETFEHGGG